MKPGNIQMIADIMTKMPLGNTEMLLAFSI